MTAPEAAKILDLPVDATPEQIEARFLELRRKFEDRVAKAPTPGLQAKYREGIVTITEAFETLTLAADSSALPLLRRQRPENGGPKTGPASAGSGAPLPRASSPQSAAKKSGGTGFLLAVLIALALLGAGGWWMLKSKAGNDAKARLATEQKADAERVATEARLAAEARQKAAEEEKARTEAAAKAEQERREKLLVTLRTQLAEARIVWGSFEAESRNAERKAGDARADLRALRETTPEVQAEAEARAEATRAYAAWTAEQLSRHPVRLALARVESLLSAGDPDLAQAEADTLQAGLAKLEQDIAAAGRDLLSITGSLQLAAEPGPFNWELRDAFGRTQRGLTPATADNVAVGPARVRFTRDGWPAQERTITIRRSEAGELNLVLPMGQLVLETTPANAAWTLRDALGREQAGRTPARLGEVSAGTAILRIARGEWPPLEREIEITARETHTLNLPLPTGTLAVNSEPAGAEVRVGTKILGVTPLVLRDAPAGPVVLTLQQVDYHPITLQASVVADGETKAHGAMVTSLGENEYPVVYLFRPKWFNAWATKVHVELEGQRYVSLANGTYQVLRLKPGRYTVKVDPGALGQKSTTEEITVGWRQTYFYECAVAKTTMSMTAKFALTPEAEARAAIAALQGSPSPQLIAAEPR